MHKATIRSLALATMMLCAAAANAAPFTNGSFETGTQTGSFNELHVGSTAITGWTVLGSWGIDYGSQSNGFWQAADGTRSLDLVGCNGVAGENGGIAQTFDTIAGYTYTVTFAMAGNPGAPAIKTLMVSAAGQSASYSFDSTGSSNAAMGWVDKSFTFGANDVSTTLRFNNTSDSSGCAGAALDNVRVTLSGYPVPVQSAAPVAALALALAGMFALRLRRRTGTRA